MPDAEALETLINWVGNQPFTVKDLGESRQYELARQTGITKPTLHGTRSELGKWLAAMNGRSYGDHTLVVLEWPTDTQVGTYQIQPAATANDDRLDL